jgi:galactokinase
MRVFAPGRVNLIGEHTDYSGGLVLPAAIQLGVSVTGEPGGDLVRLRSAAFGDAVELTLTGEPTGPLPGWGRYVAAVLQLLTPAAGLDATIESTVPIGAGLSSSAALTVAVGTALSSRGGLDLAHLCQEAEHRAVGVPVGLMDPAASLLGRRGCAILLDCGTEEYRYVTLPPELAIVVLDSGTRRSLEHSGYAQRRAELERGLAAFPGRRPLELTVDEVEAAGLAEVPRRRLRHVVTENERVGRCVEALEQRDLTALGRIFREGHDSLRDDFEVSTPALDSIVDRAYEAGAVGARMMGGGFGGSALILVRNDAQSALESALAGQYPQRTGRTGTMHICQVSGGPHHLTIPG